MARYLFERLGQAINDGRVKITRVSVWESENTSASYFTRAEDGSKTDRSILFGHGYDYALGAKNLGPTDPKPASPLQSTKFKPRTKGPVLFQHQPARSRRPGLHRLPS